MMGQKELAMAFSRSAGRMGWLLIGPLALQSALPAAALEAAAKGLDRSAETLLAQAPAAAGPAIPAEVQGWAAAAVAAAAKGDTATALRLQKQVVAWLEANRPTKDVFRAGALLTLGLRLAAVGRWQEALAPTEDGLKVFRELAKTNQVLQRALGASLMTLGMVLNELGRRQEALAPTEEAIKI